MNEFVARNGLISQGNIIVSGSITSTGTVTISGSIASASFASTASSADNFLARGTITAQTLVVQTITSSVDFVTGSTRFGTLSSNTHQFTGSVSITGSLTTSIAALSSAASLFLVSDGNVIKSRTAAQTLSDIAALPLAGGTLTGALSGTSATFSSLTNTYILKAGASGLISNSNLINDASGNLGLGVTPSAMSAVSGIELVQGSQIASRILANVPQLYISSNIAGDSYAPTYKVNGYATQYRLQGYDGTHAWYNAPSGTAGNAITFTQAMTLDASGRLGIGETSPQTIVHATSTNSTAPTSGTTPVGYGFSFGAGNGNNAGIWFSAGLGGDQGICGIAGSRVSNYETDLRFYTNNTNSARAFSERMRITSGGNVGISVDNPQSQLHINGTLTFSEPSFNTARLHTISHIHSSSTSTNNALIFNVSDAAGTTIERMRINGGFSISVPNATATTLFDIASVLSVGAMGLVTVYVTSGSGLGMATVIIMRDGYGGVSQATLGTQPTANYLSFSLSGTNLQVTASISAGTHTVKGTIVRITC